MTGLGPMNLICPCPQIGRMRKVTTASTLDYLISSACGDKSERFKASNLTNKIGMGDLIQRLKHWNYRGGDGHPR